MIESQAQTTDHPKIIISYAGTDKEWRDRLVSYLGKAADRYGVWNDVDEYHKNTPEVLKHAKVIVLFISPRFVYGGASPHVLQAVSERSLPVFNLLLEDLTDEEFARLRPYRILPGMNPLVKMGTDEQSSRLRGLAQTIIDYLEKDITTARTLESPVHDDATPSESTSSAADTEESKPPLTIAELSRFKRSDEVENALNRARRLATLMRVRLPIVTTSCLLFGLAEGGRGNPDYKRTPRFLWNELNASGDGAYAQALTEQFPRLGERAGKNLDSIPAQADLLSPNVVRVFEFAEELSRLTFRRTTLTNSEAERVIVTVRHILAALIVLNLRESLTGASRWLKVMVTDMAVFRETFYDFIVKYHPEDDRKVWKSILIDLKLPETQVSADYFSQPSMPGFMADDWTGRDLLGITRDVNALASLVAAYKVEPPLSIGLFGDWGSGKSHFMRQMRKRVETLSRLARDSRRPQKELGYYKNIVQIEFNAWHYIEGNLWASLVDHIFANLKLSEREDPSYADQRRDELMVKLGVKEEIQRKIDSQVQERENELDKLTERKRQAEAERVEAVAQLKGFREEARTSLEKLSVPIDLSKAEKNLLSAIGIEIGSEISAADVRKSYLATKGAWNRLRAQWQLFWTDKRVARSYLFAALLVLIAAGGPLLIQFAKFPGLPTAVASVLAFIGTFCAAAKPIWAQFQEGLKALEKHDEEIEHERQQRMTQLESKIRLLETEVLDAKLEGKTVGKEIEKLKADIAATTSSKILAEFIEDRASASDYRRHLGLLALIRRDFEKLRVLFDQQRREEIHGNERSDDKRINRIVLYIDDLDRCPPDRVVQVLQAIHLLLAFPIFVVVVGVDSRWITRSLQQSYEWLREVDEDEETQRPENRDADGRDAAGATPHDYLEKIFQIPFWLRSMNEDACKDLLDGLTADREESPASENGQGVVVGEKNVAQEESVEFLPAASSTLQADDLVVAGPEKSIVYDKSINIPPGIIKPDIPQPTSPIPKPITSAERKPESDDIELSPRSLTFSNHEIVYMKKLVPLIGRSPRAVKRFLNCYRLIKVGLTAEEFETFVGEEGESQSYKAAMILLGVITGAPTVSSYFLKELKAWRKEKFMKGTSLAAKLASDAEVTQQPDASRLFAFLETHDFGEPFEELFAEIVRFAPKISRFSFRVGRAEISGQRF